MKKPFQTYVSDSQIFNGKAPVRHFLRRRRVMVWLGNKANCSKMVLNTIFINNLTKVKQYE